MGRHPYTYAADLVRNWAGHDENGAILSRSSASKIITGFAEIIGMTKEELSEKLSEYFQANEGQITDNVVEELKRSLPTTSRLNPEPRGSLLLDDQDDYKGADHD